MIALFKRQQWFVAITYCLSCTKGIDHRIVQDLSSESPGFRARHCQRLEVRSRVNGVRSRVSGVRSRSSESPGFRARHCQRLDVRSRVSGTLLVVINKSHPIINVFNSTTAFVSKQLLLPLRTLLRHNEHRLVSSVDYNVSTCALYYSLVRNL